MHEVHVFQLDIGPERPHVVLDLPAALVVPAYKCQSSAATRQFDRGCSPNSGGCPCHDYALSREMHGSRLSGLRDDEESFSSGKLVQNSGT
jgi:hypothetical protein